jgi:hypothetical protein
VAQENKMGMMIIEITIMDLHSLFLIRNISPNRTY